MPMIVVKMIVPRMLIILGCPWFIGPAGNTGPSPMSPIGVRWPWSSVGSACATAGMSRFGQGAGEVIQLVQASLWGDYLASAGARICEDGAQVILSAGQPGVRGTVGAS
jgi:hypothetical protein